MDKKKINILGVLGGVICGGILAATIFTFFVDMSQARRLEFKLFVFACVAGGYIGNNFRLTHEDQTEIFNQAENEE